MENDVCVGKVRRYCYVIKISQLIENHKITVKRETNTIHYAEHRGKLKLSKFSGELRSSRMLRSAGYTDQNLENSNTLVRELLKSLNSITE